MSKFAIVLSGCGQHDGSETHEVILTLLAMAKHNVDWEAFAPDIESNRTINHITEAEEPEKRSVLKEASRLVRGKIKPLSQAEPKNFDAIVFPGGFGAVSVLCDWADQGENFTFHQDVQKFVEKGKSLQKPMGFICIAPILATKIFDSAKITIGNDKDLANKINAAGSEHIDCSASDVVIDYKNKIVSTPANMVAKNVYEVYEGIDKLIKELNQMQA